MAEKGPPLGRSETVSSTASDAKAVGSTNLLDENGEIRLIPMPTPDPKDPLNLPERNKWIMIATLCFFGSLALAAEVIVGALIPVFLLEYSGVDPRILKTEDLSSSSKQGFNPLSVIPPGVVPADIGQVSLLATIPLITNGVASYLLIPLSVAIGRRPVLILTGASAWIGGVVAGFSANLGTHLVGRALQGLGAGTVEALIPLIVQDTMFIHQRNKAMSAVVSSQGIFIIALGFAAPFFAVNYTWRILYYLTSGLGFIAWVLLIFFLPETRWMRSSEELSGQAVYHLEPGQKRPTLDPQRYGPRTFWTTVGFFQFGFEWKEAGKSMLDTIRTTLFPALVWTTLTNAAFNIINQASQQLSSFALIGQGISFEFTGIATIPSIAATVVVYFLGGTISDRVSLAITRRNGGVREAEYQLPNLIIPFVSGILGCFVFGYAAENNLHWGYILLGGFFLIFGFLTVLTVSNVFVVESYPQWAGPSLVNVNSMKIIISFFLSSQITTWVAEKGVLNTFAIYAEALIVLSLGVPVLYLTGKRIRIWTAGNVKKHRDVESLKKVDTNGSV